MTQPHYIDRELAAIISDEEIVRVHGSANFGSMPPRQVVNDGISKIAVGYHCGHTQFSILRDHGLITKPKGMSYDCNLTKKGKRYFRVLSSRPAPMEAEPVSNSYKLSAPMEAVAWREKVARIVLDGVFEGFEHGQCEAFWEPAWGQHIAERTTDAILQALAVIPTQGAAGDRERIIAAMSIELERHPAFAGAPTPSLVWCSRLYDASHPTPGGETLQSPQPGETV